MFKNTSRICSWNQTLYEKYQLVEMTFIILGLTLIRVVTCHGTCLFFVEHDSKNGKGLYRGKEKRMPGDF